MFVYCVTMETQCLCILFSPSVLMGTQEVECENVEEVMLLLEQGSSYRHTASTQMNDHSSRSHSIFTVFIGESLMKSYHTSLTL